MKTNALTETFPNFSFFFRNLLNNKKKHSAVKSTTSKFEIHNSFIALWPSVYLIIFQLNIINTSSKREYKLSPSLSNKLCNVYITKTLHYLEGDNVSSRAAIPLDFKNWQKITFSCKNSKPNIKKANKNSDAKRKPNDGNKTCRAQKILSYSM